jgi:hypothetical protein
MFAFGRFNVDVPPDIYIVSVFILNRRDESGRMPCNCVEQESC